jgi:hypothetical protein
MPVLPQEVLIEEKVGFEFVFPKIEIPPTKDTDGQGNEVEEVSGMPTGPRTPIFPKEALKDEADVEETKKTRWQSQLRSAC